MSEPKEPWQGNCYFVGKIDNGFVIKQHTGSLDSIWGISRWIAKDEEEVLRLLKENVFK